MKKIKEKIINKKRKREIFEREQTIAEHKAIFNSIGDHVMGLVVVDKNGAVIRINKGFEALTGWKKKEVIGKNLIKIIPRVNKNGDIIPFKQRILSKTLLGKTFSSITPTIAPTNSDIIKKLPIFYYIRKNKSRFPVSSIITPILIKGKTVGAVEVFYDLTKEEELEQTRRDFLSIVSHQLRTPLSGINWLIEMVQKGLAGKIEKKEKEYLDEIYKANEQMVRIVSSILSATRLMDEKIFIKKEKVPIKVFLKDILIMVSSDVKKKKIVLKRPLVRRGFNIETDPEILKSIIRTFIFNAINYSMPGRKVIFGIKKESTAVVFFVRDFGIGIPKNEQKRMFERFYRGSNVKNLKPIGMGLGLNNAKLLAEKIGAKISFKSRENKGSTFYLRIPKGRTGA